MIPPWGVAPHILMYHSIAEGSDDLYTVPPERFQAQVSWLLAHGFEPISLAVLVDLLKSGDDRGLKRKVVFTFDDGYRDFLTAALPVLLNHKVPATVFLVTGMLGGRALWNESGTHLQLMTIDDVHYVKTQGISIGSHTATHANMTLLDQGELQRELRESHDALIRLGESFCSFSYPWGQWTSRVVKAVEASGYECALAVGERTPLTAANAYLLPRITMTRDMDLERFQSLLTRTRLAMEMRGIYHTLLETKYRLSKKSQKR